MYFKFKPGCGGSHTQIEDGKEVTYTAESGDIIPSDKDLEKLFKNKFVRVSMSGGTVTQSVDTPEEEKSDVQKAAEEGAKDISPEPEPEPEPEEDDEDDWEEDDEEEDEEKIPLGKECTSKFPLAGENDFKVFYRRGKGYFVTEADDEFFAMNDKKLKKADVDPFIEELLLDNEE